MPRGWKAVRPCGPLRGCFSLWALTPCPAAPRTGMRAVGSQEGAPRPQDRVACWKGGEAGRGQAAQWLDFGAGQGGVGLLVTPSQDSRLTVTVHSLSDLGPSSHPSVPPWPHLSNGEGACPPPALGEAPAAPGNPVLDTCVRRAGSAGLPDDPGLDCPVPAPPVPSPRFERSGRRGRGEDGADNGPGPGRRQQCPERGVAARPCRRSCWWSRRRARGRTR